MRNKLGLVATKEDTDDKLVKDLLQVSDWRQILVRVFSIIERFVVT
jgi:hypothetical protein